MKNPNHCEYRAKQKPGFLTERRIVSSTTEEVSAIREQILTTVQFRSTL